MSTLIGIAGTRRPWLLCCLLGLVLAGTGCGKAPVPQFKLNFENKDVSSDMEPGTQGVVNELVAAFGEPDAPYVFPETGLNLKKLEMAAGPTASDRAGKHQGLFREHCVHCHGVTGDGDGPTALFLDPYPRDYRRGIFKWKSTERSARPTNEDLKKVIREGVPGTAMPSFALLADQEIEALAEYVKYLAIRGETELFVQAMIFDEEAELPILREELIAGAIEPVMQNWNQAESQIIVPPARPATDTPEALAESIAAGRKVYLDPKAQCTKCHGPTGLGDGGSLDYDDWNKDKTGDWNADEGKNFALPKQIAKPRNLRLGTYRGGRRPLDIYRRIHAGINGSPMPALGPGLGSAGTLTQEEIWHLVDYILSLPYDPSSHPYHDTQVVVDSLRP